MDEFNKALKGNKEQDKNKVRTQILELLDTTSDRAMLKFIVAELIDKSGQVEKSIKLVKELQERS